MASDGLLLKFILVFGIIALFAASMTYSTGNEVRVSGWNELQGSISSGPNLRLYLPSAPAAPNFDWNIFSDVAKATAFVGAVFLYIGGLLAAVLVLLASIVLWLGGVIYNGSIAAVSLATFDIQGLNIPPGVKTVLQVFGFLFLFLIILTFMRLIRGSSPLDCSWHLRSSCLSFSRLSPAPSLLRGRRRRGTRRRIGTRGRKTSRSSDPTGSRP